MSVSPDPSENSFLERLEKNTGEYGKVYQRSENHLTLLVHSLGNHVVKTMVKRCNPDVSVFKKWKLTIAGNVFGTVYLGAFPCATILMMSFP